MLAAASAVQQHDDLSWALERQVGVLWRQVEGEEEAEDTLAGASVAALRNWLRQGRELSYQLLGLAARFTPDSLPGGTCRIGRRLRILRTPLLQWPLYEPIYRLKAHTRAQVGLLLGARPSSTLCRPCSHSICA